MALIEAKTAKKTKPAKKKAIIDSDSDEEPPKTRPNKRKFSSESESEDDRPKTKPRPKKRQFSSESEAESAGPKPGAKKKEDWESSDSDMGQLRNDDPSKVHLSGPKKQMEAPRGDYSSSDEDDEPPKKMPPKGHKRAISSDSGSDFEPPKGTQPKKNIKKFSSESESDLEDLPKKKEKSGDKGRAKKKVFADDSDSSEDDQPIEKPKPTKKTYFDTDSDSDSDAGPKEPERDDKPDKPKPKPKPKQWSSDDSEDEPKPVPKAPAKPKAKGMYNFSDSSDSDKEPPRHVPPKKRLDVSSDSDDSTKEGQIQSGVKGIAKRPPKGRMGSDSSDEDVASGTSPARLLQELERKYLAKKKERLRKKSTFGQDDRNDPIMARHRQLQQRCEQALARKTEEHRRMSEMEAQANRTYEQRRADLERNSNPNNANLDQQVINLRSEVFDEVTRLKAQLREREKQLVDELSNHEIDLRKAHIRCKEELDEFMTKGESGAEVATEIIEYIELSLDHKDFMISRNYEEEIKRIECEGMEVIEGGVGRPNLLVGAKQQFFKGKRFLRVWGVNFDVAAPVTMEGLFNKIVKIQSLIKESEENIRKYMLVNFM